jgi:branched-chain amino acid transport system permease protein
MGSSDEHLESQSEATQEATPGSVRQDTGGGQRSPRGQGGWREFIRPVREAYRETKQKYERAPRAIKVAVLALIVALAALLPTFMPYLTSDASYWTNILTKVGIAALLALGLNVVVGFAGLLDLGYVAFFAVGAYTFAILSGASRYSVAIQNLQPNAASLKPEWHMYLWLFFFAALAVALVAGVILGAPTLRLRGDYLAIVTLGFGEIIRITANNLNSIEGGPRGTLDIPHPEINAGGIHYAFGLHNGPYYYLLLAIIVVWIFLLRRLNDSRVGRSWAAIREDELAAAAMGVSVVRMKLMAFAIGAAVASLGGVIYASQISFISPDTFTLFNVSFGSVIILAMVVLGGMGGIAGPIVGAAVIIFLPERFRVLGDARLLVFGFALVLVMVLRPQGLIPSRRRAAELSGGEIRDTSVFEARQGST